jgi:succinate dehydrogenase/fumarate reductase flavoprotein subunit
MIGAMMKTDLDRRSALRFGALGGAWAFALPRIANALPLPRSALQMDERQCQLLVMGGGVAGVMAALAARQAGAQVILVEKAAVGLGGMSPWARYWRDVRGQETAIADRLFGKGDRGVDRTWLEASLQAASEAAPLWENWGWLNTPPLRRRALWLAQLKSAGVQVLEGTMIARTLVDRDGQFAGALALCPSHAGEAALLIRANRAVLAMGGGALRNPSGLCWGLTHDGCAIGLAAGATVRGKELTDLSTPYPRYDCLTDPRALEPEGMVEARSASLKPANIDAELSMMRGHAGPVGEVRSVRLPGSGVFTSEGVVADPHSGAVDGVPGFYAAGGSLASMAVGHSYALAGLGWSFSGAQGHLVGRLAGQAAAQQAPGLPEADALERALSELWAPRARADGYHPDWVRQNLQQSVTPFFTSYWKHADRLAAAQTLVDHLAEVLAPHLIASSGHEWRAALEVQNLLLDQQLRLRASGVRSESCGTHVREDSPDQSGSRRSHPYWVDISGTQAGSFRVTQPACNAISSPG